MTKAPTPAEVAALDLEIRQEIRAIEAEWEEEVEAHRRVLDQHLELLAWLHRQIKSPFPLKDQSKWPSVWLLNWDAFSDLVLVDPLLFDLARHQAAADLRCGPDRPINMVQGFSIIGRAAALLEAERPSQKGVPLGRIGVKLLTMRIRDLLDEENHWEIRRAEKTTDDPWDWPPLDEVATSRALVERLNQHPVLADFPNAVPQPEAIRDIFRGARRNSRSKRQG